MTLLQLSLMGTTLIVLILLMRKLAGQRLPSGFYLWLWLMAVIRLLLPIRIATPCSIYQLWQSKPQVSGSIDETAGLLMENTVMTAATDITSEMTMPAISGFFCLWLIGALICFGTALYNHWRCRRWYRTALPVEQGEILQWQQAHPLWRKYDICQSQWVTVPCTYGFLHPVILLPKERAWSKVEAEIVLRHEWNHIRHGDYLWQWLLLIVRSVHWFNPAVWLMNWACRQDLELFCDAATARQLEPARRKTYALLLLQQAVSKQQDRMFSQLKGYTCMEERIKMIMQKKQRRLSVLVAAVIIALAACSIFATSATAEEKLPQSQIQLQWPVTAQEVVISSTFGERVHPVTQEKIINEIICITGKDFDGEIVLAAADGIVRETGFDPKQGNYLLIDHASGMMLSYSHCGKVFAQQGDSVQAGDVIAFVGKTGMVTGPCLGFGVYQDGVACNPLDYLPVDDAAKSSPKLIQGIAE